MKVNFYMEKEVEKGKEYFPDGKLKYEGEYLRGERNGNGTEHYHNGIRRYICEYLNGKKNGKGIEKDDKGKVHFDGQYLNDKEIEGTKYGLHDKIVIHSRKIKGEGKE